MSNETTEQLEQRAARAEERANMLLRERDEKGLGRELQSRGEDPVVSAQFVEKYGPRISHDEDGTTLVRLADGATVKGPEGIRRLATEIRATERRSNRPNVDEIADAKRMAGHGRGIL